MIEPRFIDAAIIANRPGDPFVYRGDGSSLDGLEWQAKTDPPTWADVQAWAAPLAAAAQTATANDGTLRARADAAIATLEAAYANWANLTAAQKDAALKLNVRVGATLARLTLNKLDAAP